MSKALEGVRILDLTHMLSGPYGGMILADLGADSIKVEPPGRGEGTRRLLENDPKNSLNGFGAYFLTLNRNKRSVALNLKDEQGLEAFYALVKESDVVLDNFGAGVPARLKIDFEHLSKINPKIITCSVTGFGSDGPGSKRPAFDQVAQGYGGGMSITGTDAQHPVRAGIPIGDLGGGMFAAMGILSALVSRNATGKGQHVDISMVDVQVSMLNYMATMYLLSGEDPEPIGNSHFVHVPYDSFPTSDGFIIIAVITDNFWKNLVEIVEIEEFRNEKYDTQPGRWADKALIVDLLTAKLQQNTSAYWLEKLEAARIPCGPVNRFSQALSDSQVLHRKMVVEIDHPEGGSAKVPGNPIKLSGSGEDTYTPPPLLGQHTDEVLAEIAGYTAEQIAALKAAGAAG